MGYVPVLVLRVSKGAPTLTKGNEGLLRVLVDVWLI